MKKFKRLKVNQIAYSIHGYSDTFTDYLKELSLYNVVLKNAPDKKAKRDLKKNVPINHGVRFTLSIVVNKKTGVGYIGIAVCNKLDNFSRKVGRQISIDKAIIYRGSNGDIKSGDPLVTFTIKGIEKFDSFEIKQEVYKRLAEVRDIIHNYPESILKRNLKITYPLNYKEAINHFMAIGDKYFTLK